VIQNTEKRIREVRKMQDNYEKQIKEMSSENDVLNYDERMRVIIL